MAHGLHAFYSYSVLQGKDGQFGYLRLNANSQKVSKKGLALVDLKLVEHFDFVVGLVLLHIVFKGINLLGATIWCLNPQ